MKNGGITELWGGYASPLEKSSPKRAGELLATTPPIQRKENKMEIIEKDPTGQDVKVNVDIKATDEPPLIEVKANVDPKTIPTGNELQNFIERIERLEEEKHELSQDINEVYSEAKGRGYDVKVMRQIIKLRKMDPADRAESCFLLEEYKKMLGISD